MLQGLELSIKTCKDSMFQLKYEEMHAHWMFTSFRHMQPNWNATHHEAHISSTINLFLLRRMAKWQGMRAAAHKMSVWTLNTSLKLPRNKNANIEHLQTETLTLFISWSQNDTWNVRNESYDAGWNGRRNDCID